jgi:hypothetical protein
MPSPIDQGRLKKGTEIWSFEGVKFNKSEIN